MSYDFNFTSGELEKLTLPQLWKLKYKLARHNRICNSALLVMLRKYEEGITNRKPLSYLYRMRDIVQSMSQRGQTRELYYNKVREELEKREVDIIG